MTMIETQPTAAAAPVTFAEVRERLMPIINAMVEQVKASPAFQQIEEVAADDPRVAKLVEDFNAAPTLGEKCRIMLAAFDGMRETIARPLTPIELLEKGTRHAE